MKLKVNKEFVDRITGELHKVGDIFEANEARTNELLSDKRKFVSLVDDEVKVNSPRKSSKKK